MNFLITLLIWFSGIQVEAPQETSYDYRHPNAFYQSYDQPTFSVNSEGYKNNRRINVRRRTIVVVDDTIFEPKGKK